MSAIRADRHRTPNVDATTVASVQTVFSRSRLSHDAWRSRRLEGRVDGRTVYRYDANSSVDIFRDRAGQSATKVNLWLLVDASGSMNGEKANAAQDITATLIESFKRVPSVRLNVWQHDFDYGQHSVDLFRIYGPGMGLDRLPTMPFNGLRGNADGFALAAIGDRALAAARPGEKTLIIVISDGAPTDHGRGATNTNLIQHSHTIAEGLRDRGATVQCVAIERSTSYAFAMYKPENVIAFDYASPTKWSDLARNFGAILGKALQSKAGRR